MLSVDLFVYRNSLQGMGDSGIVLCGSAVELIARIVSFTRAGEHTNRYVWRILWIFGSLPHAADTLGCPPARCL